MSCLRLSRVGPPRPRDRKRTASGSCALALAYQDVRRFQEHLQQAYDSSKRMFPLTRYLRLQALIKEATTEQRMHLLRRAANLTCSCRTVRISDSSRSTSQGEDKVNELMQSIQNLLNGVHSRAQSVMKCARSLIRLPQVCLPAKSPPALACSADHQQWRSRIILMQRHLEKMRREYLACQKYVLTFRRYKAMKQMLKHVLKARLDCH